MGGGPIHQFVMGHAHVGGVRRWPGANGESLEVLNTGAWLVNATPHITVQEDDGPAVLHVLLRRADGTWTIGARVTREKVY